MSRATILQQSKEENTAGDAAKNEMHNEPVRHRIVMLPEVVNLSYWSENNLTDPCVALAENDVLGAFKLPAVRAILAFRWAHVRKYFFFQLFLYLMFLASSTVFTTVIASDDIDMSLSDVYTTASCKTYLVFGFIALVLNLWFLLFEMVELAASPASYLTDIWNFFDLGTHLLVFTVAGLHATRQLEQFSITTVTILLIWFNVLAYLRGFRGSGMFIRLVIKIAFEIRYFMVVWVVVLMGFANAFFVMYRAQTIDLINLGLSFVTMFAGATNGISVTYRDSSNPDFPFTDASQLYNL